MENKEITGYEIYLPVEGNIQENIIPRQIKPKKTDYFYEVLSSISVLFILSSILLLCITHSENATLYDFIVGYCIIFIPHCIVYYYIKLAIEHKISQLINLAVAIIINSILLISVAYTYAYLLNELVSKYMFGILSYIVYVMLMFIYDLCTSSNNKDIKFGLSFLSIIVMLIVYNALKIS